MRPGEYFIIKIKYPEKVYKKLDNQSNSFAVFLFKTYCFRFEMFVSESKYIVSGTEYKVCEAKYYLSWFLNIIVKTMISHYKKKTLLNLL